jgi:eukaryotic-like serine/threonine-protein kinase
MAVPADPRIGQLVHDRYRILRKLGEGGMGAVYEGEHTLIQRRVAIKCLHTQFAANPEMVARFQREAMAANATRHPNIVEVTDMGRFEDGAIFMVLEFLDGRDLGSLLNDERALPISRAVHILSQVCDALSAAHAANIVHRDLKPENIYLTTRGEDPDFVKVLDFGIAKFAETAGGGITRAGTTVGTPHYMSPEQAIGEKELDRRADIYSLGVVLFNCLAGALPFDDESFPRLMMKVVYQQAPRLSEIVPGVPPELERLVDAMLAKNPGARPQSCREVKEALAPFRQVHDSLGANVARSVSVSAVDSNMHTIPADAASASQVRVVVPMRAPGLAKWLLLAAGLLVVAVVLTATIGSLFVGEPEPAPRVAPPAARTIREPAPRVAPRAAEVGATATHDVPQSQTREEVPAPLPPAARPERRTRRARVAPIAPVVRPLAPSRPPARRSFRPVISPDEL